ncbi:MAG: hypothetical protein M3313_06930 [Actinomycetota bacterium]|nr:hypothetical protein [Actinomycetota bacterium]
MILPRPADSAKWLIIPLGFALGVLSRGSITQETLIRAAIVWVVLELLLYQARYQWNDIRGFVADQQHPDAADRGRLPGPPEMARSRVRWSAAAAAIKLTIAAGVALAFPQLHLTGVLVVAGCAVFGIAAVYEWLRAVATGRTGQVPPPVRPHLLGLWVVVGAGYAIRGVTGVALAVDVNRPPALFVAAVVTLWAFGISWVTSRWALEATSFGRLRDGRIRWSASSGQAREHSLALVRWLPETIDPRQFPSADGELRSWRAVQAGTSVWAPWNLAAIVTGIGAVVSGILLTSPDAARGSLVLPCLAGGAGTAAVLLVLRRRPMTVVAGGAVLIAACAVSRVEDPTVAALPWLVVTVAYTCYMQQSLSTLGHPMRGARAVIGRLGRAESEPVR